MKGYVLVTQHAWGEAVFGAVALPFERWAMYRWQEGDPDYVGLQDVLEEMAPTFVFFVHWSFLVPVAILDRFTCVNFHCTDLPYGRGGHPIENLLLAGKTETVMTAHRIVRELDAGPVYGKIGGVALTARTKVEILDGFIEPVATLLRRIVDEEPLPETQVGQVVRFARLAPSAYDWFWARRENAR